MQMEEKIEENHEKITTTRDICTLSKCIINEEMTSKDTLTCRKCHRDVHYNCSQLPVYQIQVCLMFKTRSFQCQNCVQISQKLIERVKLCRTNEIEGLQKEIKACENIIKVQDEEITQLKSRDVSVMVKEIKDSLETKMDMLEKKIETKIEKVIVEKKQKVEEVSYAKVVSNHVEKQSKKMEEISRSEKAEEQLIQSTKCNLIFHGLEESIENPAITRTIFDKKFLNNRILGFQLGLNNIKIVNAQRIGTFNEEREEKGRYRPIKVQFLNEDDKNEVLKSIIAKNKDYSSPYGVTEDLTMNERKTIKEWCKKAEEMNSQIKEKNIRWKVRGSPRTKLYFKKIVNQ